MPLARNHRHSRVGLATLAALLASVALAIAAAPTNDTPADATPVGALPYTETADVTEATNSGDDISRCGMPSNTVWYRFQPVAALRLEASAQGNDGTYTMLIVYAGVTNRDGEVTCATNTPIGGAQVFLSAAAGVVYYFAVGDEIELARPITEIPFADSFDTTDATTASDDPFCFGQGPTVWYSFTAQADVRVELNTYGSGYGATLSVYTGTRGALSTVACNAYGPGPGARVRFDAAANVIYYVMVGSAYGGPGGLLQLSALLAPPPFTFDLQLDGRGAVDMSTGVATVRGTAVCSQPAFVYVSGGLTQARPGQTIDAPFGAGFFCEGITLWSAPVSYTLTPAGRR